MAFVFLQRIMRNLLSTIFVDHFNPGLDWVIAVLVLSLALIVLGRIIFSNNFDSLSSIERFQQVNDNQKLFGILFQIVYAFLLAAVIVNFLTDEYSYILNTPVLKMTAAAVLILVFFAVRKILSATGAYAFGLVQDNDYILKVFNYYRVFSVSALWIIAFLLYFSKINKPVLLVILGVILLIIRSMSFVLIFKNQPSEKTRFWYYNILYLCTLEILPLLVFFKFVNAW